MHYAIIAAGEGSRLAHEGIMAPKPLVLLHGEHMIERLLRIFVSNHAESISIIINNESEILRQYLKEWASPVHLLEMGLPLDFRFHCVVQSTPSSMHSLEALSAVIPAGRFCLTTVDTIFRESEFAHYIQAFELMSELDADGLFAVTDYIDDEKPLYVEVDEERHITAFRDECYDGCRYISGGIYALDSSKAFPVLHRCIIDGQSRMRNFQRALLTAGLHIDAYDFSKIVDVDHASDIKNAEAFIAAQSDINTVSSNRH